MTLLSLHCSSPPLHSFSSSLLLLCSRNRWWEMPGSITAPYRHRAQLVQKDHSNDGLFKTHLPCIVKVWIVHINSGLFLWIFSVLSTISTWKKTWNRPASNHWKDEKFGTCTFYVLLSLQYTPEWLTLMIRWTVLIKTAVIRHELMCCVHITQHSEKPMGWLRTTFCD